MQASFLSHTGVLRSNGVRHCFLSLPRTWINLTVDCPTPTFAIETIDGVSVIMSWAGETHIPVDAENTVQLSQVMLHHLNLQEGQIVMVNQIATPPPCNSVTLKVTKTSDWTILALNIDQAQQSFLDQIRVFGPGQTMPLWLDGGACISFFVKSISPQLPWGLLQQSTLVEILPPSDTDLEDEKDPIIFKYFAEDVKKNCDDKDLSMISFSQTTKEKDEKLMICFLVYLIKNFIKKPGSKWKKFCWSTRVLPWPSKPMEMTLFHFDSLSVHPSLVIVSKHTLKSTPYAKCKQFIAKISRIQSPKEIMNLPAVENKKKRGINRESTTVDKENKALDVNVFCSVIVVENWLSMDTDKRQIMEVDRLFRAKLSGQCYICDSLRRQMGIAVTDIIELQTDEVSLPQIPIGIDISVIDDKFKSMTNMTSLIRRTLTELSIKCNIVINTKNVMNVAIDNQTVDIMLSTRNELPLLITPNSSALLELTQVVQMVPVTWPKFVSELDKPFKAKHIFAGSQQALNDLMMNLKIGLGLGADEHGTANPQFVLVQGSKGLGKSSLIETCLELTSKVNMIQCELIPCKPLKGKRVDTIQKKFYEVFKEAVFRRPSVVAIDDLDYLVPAQSSTEQDFGPVYEHSMQMVNCFQQLFNQLQQLNQSPGCHLLLEPLLVIVTCTSRKNLHPLLSSPQGCHYFPKTVTLLPLDPNGRVFAFQKMLSAYTNLQSTQIEVSKSDKFGKTVDIGDKGQHDLPGDLVEKILINDGNHLTNSAISRLTEGFILQDLRHLAVRTMIQAKHRCNLACTGQSVSPQFSTVENSDLESAVIGYIPQSLQALRPQTEKSLDVPTEVGGLEEAKNILEETLTWPTQYPSLFSQVSLRLRSGILLFGPPGCGKTLLANVVVKRCRINFIAIKGPELLSKYIGASEQAVRDTFQRAQSAKPCVIFFDEFDSIAPRRGHDNTGVTDRVVNQLLTQMDGVEGLNGVYVLAATSRPDLIDPALLRPGRLDKCILCPLPSESDRYEILHVLTSDLCFGEHIDWHEIAAKTEYFSGADLQCLVSTAQVKVAQELLGEELYQDVLFQQNPLVENGKESGREMSQEIVSEIEEQIIAKSGSNSSILNGSRVTQIFLESDRVKYVQINDNSLQVTENVDQLHVPSKQIVTAATMKPGMVYKRHIEAALNEVHPSVNDKERRKYDRIYNSFKGSRQASFRNTKPGGRATLA